MRDSELFYPGELAVQTCAGVREAARKTGGVIRDRMVPGMHDFIERQIMLLCASLDREGNVWASLVQGEPGFVRVVDERTLDIACDPSWLDAEDPLWRNVSADNRIGLLLIEFESRRRLRINGTVLRTTASASMRSPLPPWRRRFTRHSSNRTRSTKRCRASMISIR